MQSVIEKSAWLREVDSDFVGNMLALRTSNGYAVWRIWVDRDVRAGLPTFINVDRKRLLDSVTLYHRVTDEASAWAELNGGAVLELHNYALPRDLRDEEEIRRVFMEELHHYFPELEGLMISDEVLQVRRDFPAFAPGQHALRPAPETVVRGLLMAGDWVRLPYPMTHMEAAYVSGLSSANVIFRDLGLREERISTVAPRGLLAPTRANAARPALQTP
jgi:isorenieratene synthase